MAGDRIRHLGDDDFDDALREIPGTVLVDFWATWCAPCQAIAPALDEIANEMEGQVTIVKVDVDEAGDLMSRFGIRSIPTLVVFRDGRMVDRLVGGVRKDLIVQLIRKHVA